MTLKGTSSVCVTTSWNNSRLMLLKKSCRTLNKSGVQPFVQIWAPRSLVCFAFFEQSLLDISLRLQKKPHLVRKVLVFHYPKGAYKSKNIVIFLSCQNYISVRKTQNTTVIERTKSVLWPDNPHQSIVPSLWFILWHKRPAGLYSSAFFRKNKFTENLVGFEWLVLLITLTQSLQT